MAMLAEKRRKTKFVLTPVAKPLWTLESSGMQMGKRLMEKMGWSAGKGLGASEQGIAEPLKSGFKQDSKGMGYKGHGNPFENLDQFNALLSSLSTNGDETNDEQQSFVSLEEKSKHSRSRVHYKKFTRGKDLSKCSRVDLTCLVGVGKKEEEPDITEDDVDNTGQSDHSHGVTTINSGSLADYFKAKMSQRKMLGNAQEEVTAPGCPEALEETHQENESEISGGRERKRSKKSKRNECSEQIDQELNIEVQVNSIEALDSNNEGSSKKKKRKKREGPERETPNIVSEEASNIKIEEKEEAFSLKECESLDLQNKGSSKKVNRNKREKPAEEQIASEESADLGNELNEEPSYKKKKRKNKEKDVHEGEKQKSEGILNNDQPQEDILKKKKKQKKIHPEEDVNTSPVELEEITKRSKKKKKARSTDEVALDESESSTSAKKRKTEKVRDQEVEEKIIENGCEDDHQRKKSKKKKKDKDRPTEVDDCEDSTAAPEQKLDKNKFLDKEIEPSDKSNLKSIAAKFVGSNLSALPGYSSRRVTTTDPSLG